MMVSSLSGSFGWQNAFFQTHCFKHVLFWISSTVRRHMMCWGTMGAKQSSLVHGTGLWFPRTTILLIAWMGLPCEYVFIVCMCIDGIFFAPNSFWYYLYCYPAISLNISWSIYPTCSSLYKSSHISLSAKLGLSEALRLLGHICLHPLAYVWVDFPWKWYFCHLGISVPSSAIPWKFLFRQGR